MFKKTTWSLGSVVGAIPKEKSNGWGLPSVVVGHLGVYVAVGTTRVVAAFTAGNNVSLEVVLGAGWANLVSNVCQFPQVNVPVRAAHIIFKDV